MKKGEDGSMDEQKDPREELHPQEDTQEAQQDDSEEGLKEYSFLQETIKRDRRGERKGFFRMAGLGLVFGLFACFSFSAMKPAMDSIFQGDPQQVTIPPEEELPKETEPEEQPHEEAAPQPLDADSYRQMQQSLTSIGVKANRSVVEIAGVLEEQDWTEESKEYKNSVSGLIVADNGRELLILGKSAVAKESKEIKIVFNNGQAYPATLKKSDGNLGFGIYAVNRTEIEDSTWAQVDTAVLGSSNAVAKGDIAIVLGKPFGYAGAMGFGSIASGKNVRDSADGQYRLINTDIAGSKNGSGFIVNLKGEIIALIDQSAAEEDSTELIIGYGITDVKEVIEFLSNGQGVPYIGVWGVDVTEEIEEQGIPKGLYVKNVDADSPAMAAGIQSGDVITSMDEVEITSYGVYHGTLMEKKVGSELVLKGQRQGADGYVDIDFKVTVGSKEM